MASDNTLEFTPRGIAKSGASYSVNVDDFVPADPRVFAPPAVEPVGIRVVTQSKLLGSEPLDVLKAARARLRFVRSEVKKLRKLEREQAQLERLLAAAMRPIAAVRQIKTSAG
jgi:hypothetical protein